MRVRAVGVGESGVPWMAASSCSARRRESIELREGTPSASSGVRSPDAGLDVGDWERCWSDDVMLIRMAWDVGVVNSPSSLSPIRVLVNCQKQILTQVCLSSESCQYCVSVKIQN